MQSSAAPAWVHLIPFAVVILVLALRWRRLARVQPLRLDRLWIAPAILGAIVVASFAAAPPGGLGWLWSALALIVGAALGWQRGRAMRIAVDPETGALNQTGSPAALVFIAVLLVIRNLGRYEAGAYGLSPTLVSDILLAIALGLVAATRAEMYLRGRRLLAAA